MTYEEFADARLGALLRYAVMLTGDPHQAQDLVQETMVRVQLHWRRVARSDVPERYVRRMLTNQFIDWRRGSWARRVLLRGEVDDSVPAHGRPRPVRCGPGPGPVLAVPVAPAAARRPGAALLRGPAGRGDSRDPRLRRGHRPVQHLARAGHPPSRTRGGLLMIEDELRAAFARLEESTPPVGPVRAAVDRAVITRRRRRRRVRLAGTALAVAAVALGRLHRHGAPATGAHGGALARHAGAGARRRVEPAAARRRPVRRQPPCRLDPAGARAGRPEPALPGVAPA